MDLSVVIPCFNEERNIFACLDSLVSQDYPKNAYEIIVVDNDSTDSTIEMARKFNVTVLEEKSRGVNAARNKGIGVAQGRIIAFFDADTVVARDWVKRVVGLFDNSPHLGLLGGPDCSFEDEPYWGRMIGLMELSEGFIPDHGHDLYWFKTCNCACLKEALLKAGGFDEGCTFYFTETPLFSRMIKAGFAARFDKGISVYHKRDPSIFHFIETAFMFGRNKALSGFYGIKDLCAFLILFFIILTACMCFVDTNVSFYLLVNFLIITAAYIFLKFFRTRNGFFALVNSPLLALLICIKWACWGAGFACGMTGIRGFKKET